MSKLGGVLGTDTGRTQRALQSATPGLLSGLADKVAQPGGSRAVMGMLDDVERSQQVGVLDSDARLGTGMLDGIFGSDRTNLLSSLAGSAGVSSGVIGKLLPMLAPMVMGILAKRRAAEGLDESGLANLLAREKSGLENSGLLGGVGKGAIGAAAAGTGAVGAAAGRGNTAVRERVAAAPQPASGGRFGWLRWVIGAVVLLAIAGWALSQCGSNDLTDTATGAADAVGDAADEAADTAGEVVDDAGDAAGEVVDDATDVAGEVVDDATDAAGDAADAVVGIDLQPDVDLALAGVGTAGLAAVVDDNGVVTLTGEAEDEAAKAAAEAAVGNVEGITSLDNQIVVTATEDAEEESAAPASGSTINELLDLDPITFAVNSADITAEGKTVLAAAVGFMAANSDVAVEIGGHTDSDGDDASNLALSQDRADSVKAYLESEGIVGDRMTTKGYGEAEPKVDNDTPENKAINRRIELTVQ